MWIVLVENGYSLYKSKFDNLKEAQEEFEDELKNHQNTDFAVYLTEIIQYVDPDEGE